jgi:tRNA threonylcarbamoyl adenosine modification protein YjeE
VIREIHLADEGATLALGQRLGAVAQAGDVIALHGTLGAGKTCLARGFAAGADVIDLRSVNSPTFALWNIHPGRVVMHHVDLYRLGDADEIMALGLEEVVGLEGVCLIEWPSRAPEILPEDTLHVTLTTDGAGRHARLEAHGARSVRYLEALAP